MSQPWLTTDEAGRMGLVSDLCFTSLALSQFSLLCCLLLSPILPRTIPSVLTQCLDFTLPYFWSVLTLCFLFLWAFLWSCTQHLVPPTWPTSRHPPSACPSSHGALSLPPLRAILAATVTLLPTITILCAAVSDGSKATSPLLLPTLLLLIALVVTSGQRFWEAIFFMLVFCGRDWGRMRCDLTKGVLGTLFWPRSEMDSLHPVLLT